MALRTPARDPVTPGRDIPGAFINTPGPNTVRRQLNFKETAFAGQARSMTSAPAPIASTLGTPQPSSTNGMLALPPARDDSPPVAKAAQVINQTLQLDDSYADLDSYCRRTRPS